MAGEVDRGPELAAVAITMMAVSVVSVGLRCYTMAGILKRFYAEDYLAILTLVSHTWSARYCATVHPDSYTACAMCAVDLRCARCQVRSRQSRQPGVSR